MSGNGNRIETDAIVGNKMNFTNHFITEVIYKNGAKETINHISVPQPDPNKMLHIKVSESEGLCINLDEVRRFHTTVKSISTLSKTLIS